MVTQGVEMYVGSTWEDITSYVYWRDGIEIVRGRSDESAQPEPARIRFTLNNRDYRFSPRCPDGTWFGQIGRNSKIRHWVEEGEVRLRLEGGDQFYAADSAGLSVTGDIDLRADVALPTWRPDADGYVGIIKGGSYALALSTTGHLRLYWTTSTVADYLESTEPVPGGTTGRKGVRATLDVNNGSSGKTARFYYSDDDTMDGSWVEFGDAVTEAGTTSIDDTAQTLGAYLSWAGEINEIRVYQGIAGTLRASPKFTTQTSGATSFADAQSNTWTESGTASLDNRHYRFWGDSTVWPIKWDPVGNDIYVPIECQGVTRRIGQGNTPTKSPLRRGTQAIGSNLVTYWPLEDGASSKSLEAGTANTIVGRAHGPVKLAAYDDFIASDPVPEIHTGRLFLTAPYYTNTNEFQVRFIMHVPPDTVPDNAVLVRIYTNNSLRIIDWVYNTGDVMEFKCRNHKGDSFTAVSLLDMTDQVLHQDTRISLEFAQNGANVSVSMTALPIGEATGVSASGTVSSATLGSCTNIHVNPDGNDVGEFAIGHISVEKDLTDIFTSSSTAHERAYLGESAVTRIDRLCTEEGLTVNLRGANDASEYLGYQGRGDILDLLHDAADADGGILTEQRDADALIFRSRESMYNQAVRASIVYTDGSLQQLEPLDDDQFTRNKITVQRTDGQRATVEDTDSPMSTSAPPDGVGEYNSSLEVSLYSDDQAVHHAGWRVRLGTVDEYRWPQIGMELAHPDFTSDDELTRQILSLDCGDRFDISGLPAWLPPETASEVVQGYTERLDQHRHSIVFTCTPYSPYRAGMYDGHPTTGRSRYSNENTTLNEDLTTTETGVDVAFSAGPGWSNSAAPYDIMVGGERMTVTAAGAASSPQTLTVTRSVNSVVKTHSSGADVRLFDPVFYALGASGASGTGGDIDEGMSVKALDFSLPDISTAYGEGVNAITDTTYAALPSYPCVAEIHNPHPTAPMLCLVYFGAWMSASTNDVRIAVKCVRAEQAYITPGIGGDGPAGWGSIPANLTSVLESHLASFTTELDASPYPYRFEIWAARAGASGSQDVRYATLRIIPLHYVDI